VNRVIGGILDPKEPARLHDDPFLNELITFGLALLVLLPTAALSGHIIAHRVRKKIDRFGEMTPRQTFFFGI
jgi:hypothetical protein